MIRIYVSGFSTSDSGGPRWGDCTVIDDGENYEVIDGYCGVGASRMMKRLKDRKIRDPYLYISHPHYDHYKLIRDIIPFQNFKCIEAAAQDLCRLAGSKTGDEVNLVTDNCKGTDVDAGELINLFHFCQVHSAVILRVPEAVQFSAPGTPDIESVRCLVIGSEVRTVSDLVKFLRHQKLTVDFLKNHNPVVLRVISKVNLPIGSDGMRLAHFSGKYVPVCKRIGHVVVTDDLVVITVYEKP